MEYIGDFMIKSGVMLVYLLAFVFAGGIIINFIENKSNYFLQKAMGYSGMLITGLGTVIHELSHLIFVILGGMKATEIKLFRPIKGRIDGKLGYVSYSYNKRNFYNKMFLVLVGIAPIIGGTLVLLISLRICFPEIHQFLMSNIIDINSARNIFSWEFISELYRLVADIFVSLFTISNIKTINFWIFIFIVLSVASHMSLSSADVKGAISGIPAMYVLVIIVNFIVILFGKSVDVVMSWISVINGYTIIFLSIAVVFSLINLVLSICISLTVSLFNK